MTSPGNQPTKLKRNLVTTAIVALALLFAAYYLFFWRTAESLRPDLRNVSTIAGKGGEFGEPFGIAVKGEKTYVSDGDRGMIFGGRGGEFLGGATVDTPSAIAFDGDSLIIASSGHNAIYRYSPDSFEAVVGRPGERGHRDGPAEEALFNGPIGVAVGPDGRVFVADSYNDRIRVIENGSVKKIDSLRVYEYGAVSTLAGGPRGFADGSGPEARFDTPCGVSVWNDKLLVADTGNGRIRVIEADGRVWTLAGTGERGIKDGLIGQATFYQPMAVAVGPEGAIYVADGNSIRRIEGVVPTVRTLTSTRRGLRDGPIGMARFNRPSGLAFAPNGDLLVTDSENRLVRRLSVEPGTPISTAEIEALRDKPEEFRNAHSARWPYDPPQTPRDVAGTLGEIRGEVSAESDEMRFHNGFDIAGAYGETARFIRNEKVLNPFAAQNFGTLRELLRLPTLGYIHIRLGRDQNSRLFPDDRFQFDRDASGRLSDVRIPRGVRFSAGDAVGTLNAMNHVHLIVGRTGQEMNALDALILPGLRDTRPPVIEEVALYDENWRPIEPDTQTKRIKLVGKTRIVVQAFDQADGGSDRRRLGLFQLGYSIGREEQLAETTWTIKFARNPDSDAVAFVYANGSKSGPTGPTVFRYIVTNLVDGDDVRERFLDVTALENGIYTLRVFGGDYFGNIAHKDLSIEVAK